MFDPNNWEQIHDKFTKSLPPSLQHASEEIEQFFKEIMQTMLNKMELVTREEFDVQTKVLEKTRKKLDELAKRVKDLEN